MKMMMIHVVLIIFLVFYEEPFFDGGLFPFICVCAHFWVLRFLISYINSAASFVTIVSLDFYLIKRTKTTKKTYPKGSSWKEHTIM